MLATMLVAGAAGAPVAGSAQEPAGEGTEARAAVRVDAARRLAAADSMAAAIDTLRAYLAGAPADGGTRWLLARYLREAGRDVAAAEAYERALVLLPGDPWLRLEYARHLLALGEAEHVEGVLDPVLAGDAPASARAQALTLAGTAAYWRGDLGAATRSFREALAADSGQAEARRQLGEIRSLTRPWLSVGGAVLDDNQPYRRYRALVEGGAYVSPAWTLAGAVVPRLLDVPPGVGATDGAQTGAAAAWAELAGRIPSPRLGIRVRFGGWWAGGVDDGDAPPGPGRGPRAGESASGSEAAWLGAAELSLGLPIGMALRVGASRDRYLATSTAVDTLVMMRALEARLGRPAAPDWAGEVVARLEVFPDENVVSTAYAWLLAPALPGIRVGWAGSWQDSEESRWSLVGADDARYMPYYTPERVTVQSLLGEALVGAGPVEVRVSGRYGLVAREQAPRIIVEDGGDDGIVTARTFEEREFTPWEARVEVTAEPAGLPELRLTASREATAFWTQSRLELRATYRFPAGAVP